DEFLPAYDVNERHHIDVHAPAEKVYQVVQSLDFRDSRIVKWLFRLRGIPEYALTLDGLLELGFVILGETPNQEIVIGLVGRFWTRAVDIQHLDPGTFRNFDRKGFAKAIANISLSRQTDTITRVTTETRVHCIGNSSRRYFRLYWFLISPFSAWIRREWLRIIKRRVEMEE
ncbi:MAG: hypothetical protein JSV50_02220, partial [Desulfobacteraceae bacterium]